LAQARQRTPHGLMRDAITQYVDREEKIGLLNLMDSPSILYQKNAPKICAQHYAYGHPYASNTILPTCKNR
jgi:hypothetical protein